MSPTRTILDFAMAPHRLPPGVAADTDRLVADTLAVGVAGSSAPGADAMLAAVAGMGDGGEVPVLGRGVRLPTLAAAMLNGFHIHCLEWDAVHEPAVVHAMSVVTAAVHAAAHRMQGVDPEAARTAVAVGVEIACLLGVAATGPLRFFRPAVSGVMGAALAVARLRQLPNPEDALGFAHAQAAGTMQAHVEGRIALPVQIGLAARAAVTAADLAQQGLVAAHDVLEGPFGHFALFENGTLAPHVGSLGRAWRISEISVKPWPSGRASHALLGVLESHGPADRIVAHVPALVDRLVNRPWREDMTPAWARLCLPFLAALMMADGRIDPRRFTAESFVDPALKALGTRLAVRVDDNPDPNALSPQRFLVDGKEYRVAATPGSPANPLAEAQQAAKQALALSLAAEPAPFDPVTMLSGHA